MNELLKKGKKSFTKFIAIALLFTLGFTNSSLVYAVDTKNGNQTDYSISYVSGKVYHSCGVHGNMMEVNGITAFCTQALADTPHKGDVLSVVETTNDSLRKVLWYGYGGPSGYSGTSTDDYICTTQAASVACTDYTVNNGRFRTWFNTINEMPSPPESFHVYEGNPNNGRQIVAFAIYNPEGTLQLKKSSSNSTLTSDCICYSLSGAVYGVYSDEDCKTKVGTLTTDKSGDSNKIGLSEGTYYVKEITAPDGFYLDDTVYKVNVESDKNCVVNVSEVPYMDPVGLLLKKVDAETGNGQGQNGLSLANAEFEVKYYATTDSSSDPAKRGESPVRTWVFTTDKDGFTYYSKDYLTRGDELYMSPTGAASLPVGTITIQEIKAPEGYELNPETFIVPIKYQHSTSTIVTYNAPVIPDKLLGVDIIKIDAETREAQEGVEFEHTSPDGSKETLKTDKNGKITINGLAYGEHSVKETAALNGFALNSNIIKFVVNEDGSINITSNAEDVEKNGNVTVSEGDNGNITVVMENKPTVIELSKVSITDNKELPGATLEVTDSNGNPIDSWVSGEEPHIIKGLTVGETYTLTEVIPADGFVSAESIEFTVENTGKVQKITMVDDITKVQITKVDVNGNPVPGATLQVVPLDEEGHPLPEEGYDAWLTDVDDPETKDVDESIHSIYQIPIGNYMLIETNAPEGYAKAEPVVFAVSDTADVQKVTMINKQVSVTKTDIATGEELPGAEIEVKDKETGDVIDKWTSTEEPHIIIGLEEGKTYILTETTAPKGYDVAEDIEFTVDGLTEDGIKLNQHIIMEDSHLLTDLHVKKVDSVSKEPIKGKHFEFTLYADKECKGKIATVSGDSDTGVAVFDNLDFGTYYLKETKAPKGYQLSDDVVEIVIEKDMDCVGDKYEIIFENDLKPKNIIKTGDNNGMLVSVTLSIVCLFVGFVLIRKRRFGL